MDDLRTCRNCGGEFPRAEMTFTRDCHGIPFRFVCFECYDKLMEDGYDGVYYDESDECIDADY